MKFVTALIFILAYLFLVVSKERKALISWVAVLALLFLQILTPGEAFASINWNVIGLFIGTLLVAELFIYSKVPTFLADVLIGRAKNVGIALLFVCILSSFISIFVENVATVLIVAPIALALAEKLKISPIPALVAIAISSNLQGTATLIGDPPSMILGAFAKLNFLDFFLFRGRPGIFFAVEIGALLSFVVLYLIFRKFKQAVRFAERIPVVTWAPTIILGLMVLGLAGISFMPVEIPNAAALVALFSGGVGLLWFAGHNRNFSSSMQIIKSFDYDTLFFLLGIFILVSSLTQVGLIQDLASFLGTLVAGNYFLAFTVMLWLSVFLSAFIDNVPYILAMLPVTTILAGNFGVPPYLLYFGLLIGSTVGGNITPIGASANVVACGLLRKHKHPVSFLEFVKIGLPFTLAAVLGSYIFLWLVWG